MKGSYGQPPLLQPALFLKVLVVAMTVVLVGFVFAYQLMGSISGVDIAGTFICTPIATYLIHLWLAPLDSE